MPLARFKDCYFHFVLFRARKLCGVSEEELLFQLDSHPECHLSCPGVLGVSFSDCLASWCDYWYNDNNINHDVILRHLCRRRALRISPGIDHMGSLNWDLALCLFIAWVMCYFCIWKGVKSTGKVGERGYWVLTQWPNDPPTLKKIINVLLQL